MTTTPVPSTTTARKTSSAVLTTLMGRRPYLESSSTASLLHVGQGQEEVSDSGEVVVGVLSGLLLVLLVLTIGVAVLCLGRWGEGVRAELLSLYSVKVGGSQKEEVVEEKEVNKKRCLEQRHLRAGGHTAHTQLRRGSRTNLQVVNTTAPGSEVSRGEKKI